MSNSVYIQLEAEYCPPLDSSLVAAILSDYDITSEPALRAARKTLDLLKPDAILEGDTEFNPSGSGGFSAFAVEEEPAIGAVWDAQSTGRSRSGETDLTSVSRSERSMDPDGIGTWDVNDPEREYAAGLEALDSQGKEALLQEMFPTIKPFSIANILKRGRGNFKRAVDELLSLAFLGDELPNGEEIMRPKSVDAFADDHSRTKKGGRGKRWQRKLMSSAESIPSSSTSSVVSGTNAWRAIEEDIQFIASKTKLSVNAVASIYHENGASIPATIMAILDSAGNHIQLAPEESTIQDNTAALAREFPTISALHVCALIRLTHPSTAAAHELAKELVFRPPDDLSTGGIQIITQHPPVDTPAVQIDRSQPSQEYKVLLDAETVKALAIANFNKSNKAFEQASAAYRRGKSDPLFGGAAGYYSSLGRDYRATARVQTAEAADALVESQSSADVLDLHHVYVKDAVRIAREKVRIWWSCLGETQIGQRTGGYKIVTGKGNHSEGGSGKIGPAVAKMLMREKYKFEVGGGSIIVTGVAR